MISAVIAENFVYGMVGTVFIAYLMALCSRRFSATQYALLSSLMAVRVPSRWIATVAAS